MTKKSRTVDEQSAGMPEVKTCFFICPIGKPSSDIRRRADRVLREVIEPVAVPLGYKVVRGDLEPMDKPIPDAISEHVLYDDLVIADLTGENPNVFFELGKRHAWGGKCIHMAQGIKQLPFDIRHLQVHEYAIGSDLAVEKIKLELRGAIISIEKRPIQCPYPLTPQRIIDLTGATVVIDRKDGYRDHYYLAEKLAKERCESIFLMQRSSTVILGPEHGWDAEKVFYYALLEQIKQGVDFHHIVSVEGIARHLERPNSHFPDAPKTLSQLDKTTDKVGIRGRERTWYFKRIPDEGTEMDLKPDRQARTFIVELKSGAIEGVMVADLGGMQSSFRIRGEKMQEFLSKCREFYSKCDYLKWTDIDFVLSKVNNHRKDFNSKTRQRAKTRR
jgi:hypothetical protein